MQGTENSGRGGTTSNGIKFIIWFVKMSHLGQKFAYISIVLHQTCVRMKPTRKSGHVNICLINFLLWNGLKQEHASLPPLFYFISDHTISMVQVSQVGLKLRSMMIVYWQKTDILYRITQKLYQSLMSQDA